MAITAQQLAALPDADKQAIWYAMYPAYPYDPRYFDAPPAGFIGLVQQILQNTFPELAFTQGVYATGQTTGQVAATETAQTAQNVAHNVAEQITNSVTNATKGIGMGALLIGGSLLLAVLLIRGGHREYR